MSEETLRDLIALNHTLQEAYREIDELKAEAKRREEIWLGRLMASDNHAARIAKFYQNLMRDPPILIMDKTDVPRMSLEPGAVITRGERPWTKQEVIEHGDIYFRDFLRSFWKRLTGRPAS